MNSLRTTRTSAPALDLSDRVNFRDIEGTFAVKGKRQVWSVILQPTKTLPEPNDKRTNKVCAT